MHATLLALILLATISSGCNPPPDEEQQNEAPVNILTLHQLKTTVHTTDRRAHLVLCADHATRDNQTKQMTAQNVHAALTHNNINILSVTTPQAMWDEATHELTTRKVLTCQHAHGILNAKGDALLRLRVRRLDLCGPTTHTITY